MRQGTQEDEDDQRSVSEEDTSPDRGGDSCLESSHLVAELRQPERLPDELDHEELVDLPGRRVLLLPLGVVVHEGRDDLPGGGLEPLQ